MHCERCDADYLGGSVCPVCFGRLHRSRTGLFPHGERIAPPEKAMPAPRRSAEKRKEGGQGTGFLLRLCYKLLESVFACVLFSMTLRVVLFIVKVADSLMETGGDIKEGISLYTDLQRAIGWFEVGAWLLIIILIFTYRHRPD